jgi:hypothetical protein
MSHATMWLCLAFAVAVVSLGVARLVAWSSAQRLRRLDADYRAFAMVEDAKRMRDWLRWEDDTLCGAFPNRAARDAALAAANARHAAVEAELGRAVCALEAQWGVSRA